MHLSVSHLLVTYGYVFLFALVAVESFGVPLPGETALVTAAAYAATGRMNILLVVAAAAAGAIAGDNGGYWLGRKGGIALVRRYGRHVGLDQAKLDRARGFFERHGPKTIFLARFIALLRSWAAALAGVACMPYGTFTVYNALGGITWAALFGALGYLFGRNLPKLERYAGQATLAVVLLAALAVGLWLAWRWFVHNRERIVAAVEKRTADWGIAERLAAFRERHPTLWTWVGRRFSRGEYLGLHLTIGVLVALAALWLFGAVTEDVIHHDPLTRLDLRVAGWFRAHATPAGDRVGVFLATVASPLGMAVLGVLVAAILIRKREWIMLAGWGAAYAGAGVFAWLIKVIVRRPRPVGAEKFLHSYTWSFPSGHSLGSFVGYGMLAYVLVRLWAPARRHRTLVATFAAFLIVAVGLSRLYLVVHFFSDVVAGFAVGLVWLTACVSGVEIARGQRPDSLDRTVARAARRTPDAAEP